VLVARQHETAGVIALALSRHARRVGEIRVPHGMARSLTAQGGAVLDTQLAGSTLVLVSPGVGRAAQLGHVVVAAGGVEGAELAGVVALGEGRLATLEGLVGVELAGQHGAHGFAVLYDADLGVVIAGIIGVPIPVPAVLQNDLTLATSLAGFAVLGEDERHGR
jgi:hypothetical protein